MVRMAEQTSSLVFLQYLTTVFDNIADGVLLISVEPRDTFKLAMANKTFFEFSGYPNDSIGKKVSDIVSPESFMFLSRQYKKVIKNKRALEYLRWSDVPNGMRAFEVRMVPIFNTTGDCLLIACIIHDATEREQLRTEIEHLRESIRGIRKNT
jgi:PAS domain S-box-containing protein